MIDKARYQKFKDMAEALLGPLDQIERSIAISDLDDYVENLSRRAEEVLNYPGRVELRVVFNRGRVHTIVYRVNIKGLRYSAGVSLRLSLGRRDAAGTRWQHQLTKAHKTALAKPPVSMDSELESMPEWSHSNQNKTSMTFRYNSAEACLRLGRLASSKGSLRDLATLLTRIKQKMEEPWTPKI